MLAFVRLSIGEETTNCERLTWRAPEPYIPAGTAKRAEVATSTLAPLLDGVRALSRGTVSEGGRDRRFFSNDDFFVLVRVCGESAARDRTWEFTGHSSSRDEVRYAAVRAVVKRAKDALGALDWMPVPAEEYRRTHLSDAFDRNRDLYAKDVRGWVTAKAVGALGWFGNRSALPTLRWMRDTLGDLGDRSARKIDRVLESPETYLEGPPQDLADR